MPKATLLPQFSSSLIWKCSVTGLSWLIWDFGIVIFTAFIESGHSDLVPVLLSKMFPNDENRGFIQEWANIMAGFKEEDSSKNYNEPALVQ